MLVGAPPRVLITRAAEDARLLQQGLALIGAEPVIVPLLARTWQVETLAEAAYAAPPCDWLIFTSATTADVMAAAAPSAHRLARLAVVGPATARRARQHGYSPVLEPAQATAEALLAALPDLAGQHVFLPQADLAETTLADGLRAKGATVYEAVAYRNEPPIGFESQLLAALPVEATTILSGSAAQRLAASLSPEQRALLGHIIAIGPSTAKTCADLDLTVHAVASPHTASGVVEATRRLLGLSGP